jgi:hypothetical protein
LKSSDLTIYTSIAEGEQRGVSEEESMAGDGAKRTTNNSSSQPVATKVKLSMKIGNVNGKVVFELKWKANEKVCANQCKNANSKCT